MRILVLGDGSLGHTARWSGYFKERGHEVLLISFESVGDCPVPARRIRTGLPTKLLGYLSGVPAIRAETRRFRPDIVSALYVGGYGLVASLCGARPLAVMSLGSDLLVDYPSSVIHRLQIGRVLRAADLVITDADVLSRIAAAAGAQDILKAYLGVDERIFYPPSAGDPQPSQPSIVSTRNLYPIYDVGLLVEATPIILERADARFIICGEGPERRRLEERVKSLGLASRFTFKGRLAANAIAAELRGAAVYVSTSWSDSTSVSLLEAMACGALPVVTDLEANREWIIDGENGLIIGHDPHRLAEAVIRALGDEALRRSAREKNARIIAERGRWRDNMQRVEDAFARLAGA
jgi:glycosyltransferase involved in cell wall biosynthesis